MNEREVTLQRLRYHAGRAKHEIEAVLDILGWPEDAALSNALDRLLQLQEKV